MVICLIVNSRQIYSRVDYEKNIENRSIFDDVMKRASLLLWRTGYPCSKVAHTQWNTPMQTEIHQAGEFPVSHSNTYV